VSPRLGSEDESPTEMNNDQDREQHHKACRQNAQRIESEIDSLSSGHKGLLGDMDYKAFFTHAKQISEMFKATRPLFRGDRERLWARFSGLCDETRGRQQSERNRRKEISRRRRESVEEKIAHAELVIRSSPDVEYLRGADRDLEDALAMMKGGWGYIKDGFSQAGTELFAAMTNDDGKLIPEDHEICWRRWQEARKSYRLRLQDLRQANYEHAHRQAVAAYNLACSGDPYEAVETIKTTRAGLKGLSMAKDSAAIIQRMLDDAWQKATSRIEQNKAERQRKHEEWQRKQNEWRERQADHIERWQAEIDRGEDVIDDLRRQIDHLHDKLQDAWSDDYISNMEGWIREKEDKIRDIQLSNEERRDKIADVRRRLNQ
jgi:hypothetical protein